MTDQIQEIKDKIDIVQFISEYVPLKKAGRNWKALCPFHSEGTPSFMVSPERGIFKCFGCGVGGDVFAFLQKIEGIDFPEALNIVAERAGVKLTKHLPDKFYQERERLHSINSLAARYFAYILKEHRLGAKAREYLKKRGIPPEAVDRFQLGYAPKSWDNLLRYLRKRGYKEAEIDQVGLVIKSEKGKGYYDRFRGRLLFPLTDQQGNIRGFAGRLLDPEAKEAKYINTPETPIYAKRRLLYGLDVSKEAIRRSRQAIVVEGETDMISSYLAGVENVVAIKGSALTEEQVRLLRRYADDLLLAMDADFAGDEAARRGIELAEEGGLTVKVVQIPVGKDPDECVQKDPAKWRQAVSKPIPVYDFIMEAAVGRYGTDSAKSKKQVAHEVLPTLGGISDPIVQAHYLQKLARTLDTDEEVLVAAMQQFTRQIKRPKRRAIPEPEIESGRKKRQEILEEYFLSLILQGLRAIEELPKFKVELNSPVFKRIWNSIQEHLKDKKHFIYTAFVRQLPAELVETTDKLFLRNLGDLVEDRLAWQREINSTLEQLKQLHFKDEIRELSKRLEKNGRNLPSKNG